MPDIDDILSQKDVWTALRECGEPVLIYGTGNGCEKLLNAFKAEGITADGIFTSDDFSQKSTFCGLDVMPLSKALERYDNFTAVLAFGTELDDVMARIDGIESTHHLYSPELSVADNSYFTVSGLKERLEDVKKVYSLLSDSRSREVFENLLCFKITGKLCYLRRSFCDRDDTFESILKLSADEAYLDLGAYNGDTVIDFVKRTNASFRALYAFEPDMRNFRKLVKNTCGIDNIELENSAAWSEDTVIRLSGASGRMSAVGNAGRLASARSVDSFLHGRDVTYIKYDVEGADRQAILGSRETIQKFSPKICTAVYHRPYDMIDIPLLLERICKGYSYYLRQYKYYPAWETELIMVKEQSV